MELNEITLLARKLLNATRHLADGPNTYKSSFARVVEGTFRRDYLTLYTMVYLAGQDQPAARTAYGTSCMDLCRRVLEDVVSLEYMLLKGKEAYAMKFSDYRAIEAKHDMDYLEAAGLTIDEEYKRTRNEEYDEVKRQFLDSSSKAKLKACNELVAFLKSQDMIDQQSEKLIKEELNRKYPEVNDQTRKAWAGLDTEAMIGELVKAGVRNADEGKVLMQMYQMGNRKNHFSPTDIFVFLSDAYYRAVNDRDLVLSLIATTTLMTRMARIFADEVDVPNDTIQAIEEIAQTLLTAHLSVKE